MAYDEGLAQRLREALEDEPQVVEKKMFGGLCFMVRGHMTVGIVKDELMVRVGPDTYRECLTLPHAREMDFTGRALKGFVYVGVEGFEDDAELGAWVERGAANARSLPVKTVKKATKKKTSKARKKR